MVHKKVIHALAHEVFLDWSCSHTKHRFGNVAFSVNSYQKEELKLKIKKKNQNQQKSV